MPASRPIRRSMSGCVLAAILLSCIVVTAGFGQAGTKKKPPVNPPKSPSGVTDPTKRPAKPDRIGEFHAIVSATLDHIRTEWLALKTRIERELVGKTAQSGLANGVRRGALTVDDFKRIVVNSAEELPGSIDDRDRALASYITTCQTNLQSVRAGRMSEHEFYAFGYKSVRVSILELWKLHMDTLCRGDMSILVAEQTIAANKIRDSHISALGAALKGKNAATPGYYDLLIAIHNRFIEPYQQCVQTFLERSADLYAGFSAVRRRWGAETWRWHDFAEKTSALKTDAHGTAANAFTESLGWFTPAPSGGVGIFYFLVPPDPFVGTYDPSKPFPKPDANPYLWNRVHDYVRAKPYPKMQVSTRELSGTVLGSVLMKVPDDPPVEKLRGYVEVPVGWGIADAIIVPEPGVFVEDNRVAPSQFEGSDSYVIYVYGPRIPTTRAALKSVRSDVKGVRYTPLAFQSERDAKTLSPALGLQWDAGQFAIRKRYGTSEAALTDVKDLPAMLIRVSLVPAILPGRKKFQINGADGGWYLDLGTGKAEVAIVREMPKSAGETAPRVEGPPIPRGKGIEGDDVVHRESPFEATEYIYPGERIFGQIQVNFPVDADEIGVVFGRNRVWCSFDGREIIPAVRVKEDPRFYRTQPIQIVQGGDPRLDPADLQSGREPGVLYLAAEPGDTLHVQFQDTRAFVTRRSLADALVSPGAEWLWASALRRAAKCAGKYEEILDWNTLPGQKALEIRNYLITQVAFKLRLQYLSPLVRFIQACYGFTDAELAKGDVVASSRVTIGNHAAMLLLRDHFVELMDEAMRHLDEIKSEEQILAFLDSKAVEMRDPHFPMGRIIVDSVEVGMGGFSKSVNTYLSDFFDESSKGVIDANERETPGRSRALKLKGFKRYKESAAAALKKAIELKDEDIQGLLELTGNHFTAVGRDLTPRLLKPIRDDQAGAVRWEPDYTARAEVNTLCSLWSAVQAQKDWSELDTNVAIAAVSVIPVFLPGQLLRVGGFLALNAFNVAYTLSSTLPGVVRKQTEYQFSLGASAVLGSARFNMAELQETAVWAIFLNLAMTAVGLRGDIMEVMSVANKLQTVRLAAKAADALEKTGLGALGTLASKEQAAFLQAAIAIEAKEAAQGAKALAPNERRIKDLMVRLKGETQELRHATQVVPEADILKPATLPDGPPPPQPPPVNPPARPALPPTPQVEELKLPTLRPEEREVYVTPNDATLILADRLGKPSKYFDVFKLKSIDSVVKFLKEGSVYTAGQTIKGVRHASKILREAKIPHLKLLNSYLKEKSSFGYYIQEYLPKNLTRGQESFFVSDWITQFGRGKSEIPLTAEMQDAVSELFGTMLEKKIIFDDCKWDNIFIRRVLDKTKANFGKLECGVADLDRIAYWGDLNASTDELNYWVSVMETRQDRFGLKSIRTNPMAEPDWRGGVGGLSEQRLLDLETYWETMLERLGWLRFEGGRFKDGFLSLKSASKHFKRIPTRGVVDLGAAQPFVPPVPKPAPGLRGSWLPDAVRRMFGPRIAIPVPQSRCGALRPEFCPA